LLLSVEIALKVSALTHQIAYPESITTLTVIPEQTMSIYLYRFFYLLTVISFALLLAAIGKDAIHANQIAKRPQTPQPELGLTIPSHVGNRSVYISREDHDRIYELEGYRLWAALALSVFGLTAAAFRRARRFDA